MVVTVNYAFEGPVHGRTDPAQSADVQVRWANLTQIDRDDRIPGMTRDFMHRGQRVAAIIAVHESGLRNVPRIETLVRTHIARASTRDRVKQRGDNGGLELSRWQLIDALKLSSTRSYQVNSDKTLASRVRNQARWRPGTRYAS